MTETYKTLKYIIKHADISLIKKVISVCCILFENNRQTNYTFEILYFFHFISISICDDVLQQVILSNNLINIKNKTDTWKKIDIFMKHFNLQLKQLFWTHKNSIFDINQFFEITALTDKYCVMLAAFLQKSISHQSNFNHKNKTSVNNIHILTYELLERSVYNTDTNKNSSFDNLNYLADDTYWLVNKKKIKNFNNKIVQLEKMLQSSAEYMFENTENMFADLQFHNFIVWIILFFLIHLLIYSQTADNFYAIIYIIEDNDICKNMKAHNSHNISNS